MKYQNYQKDANFQAAGERRRQKLQADRPELNKWKPKPVDGNNLDEPWEAGAQPAAVPKTVNKPDPNNAAPVAAVGGAAVGAGAKAGAKAGAPAGVGAKAAAVAGAKAGAPAQPQKPFVDSAPNMPGYNPNDPNGPARHQASLRPQPMPTRDNVATGNRVRTYHDTTLGKDMQTGTYKWGKGTGNSQADRDAQAAAQGMSPVYGRNGFEGYKPMAQVQKEVNQLGTGHVPGQSALRDAYVARAMRENNNQPTGTNPQIELQIQQDIADGKLGSQHIENINAQGYTGHVGPQGLPGTPGLRARAQNPFDDLDGVDNVAPWVRKKLTEVPPVRPGDELGGAKMASRGGSDMSVPRLNKNYAPDPFANAAPSQPTQPIPEYYTDQEGVWNATTGEKLPGVPQLPGNPIPGTPPPMTPAPDTGFDSKSTIPGNNIPQPAAPQPAAPTPTPDPIAADPYGGGSGFLQDPSRNRRLDHEGGGSGFLQNPERNAPIDDATRSRVAESWQKHRDGVYDEGMDRLAEYEAEDEQAYQDDMSRLDEYEATGTGGTGDPYENAMAEYGGPEQMEEDYHNDYTIGYEQANEGFDDLKDHYVEQNQQREDSMQPGGEAHRMMFPEMYPAPAPEAVSAPQAPVDAPAGDPANTVPGGPGSEPDTYEMDEFDEEEERRRMIEELERQQQQMGQHWS